jgi:hypothetical protein
MFFNMSEIMLFKIGAGNPKEATKKLYDEIFPTYLEALKFVEEKILPIETTYKYVSFTMNNVGGVKKIREYLFMDDDENHKYSYRIIEK